MKMWLDSHPWSSTTSTFKGATRSPCQRLLLEVNSVRCAILMSWTSSGGLCQFSAPFILGPHNEGITDLLGQKIELGDVQTLAGHADPRTTRLYDRSERKVTRNLVERIKIGR